METPQTNPSVSSPASSGSKAGIIAVVVLALLLGGVGGYWMGARGEAENSYVSVSPTPSTNVSTSDVDTSMWQTYRNEEYGFEFRYPTDVIVTTQDFREEGGDIFSYFLVNVIGSGTGKEFGISIDGYGADVPSEHISSSNIIVNGISVNKSLDWDTQQGAPRSEWQKMLKYSFASSDATPYTIIVAPYVLETEVFVDQILYTFKFTR